MYNRFLDESLVSFAESLKTSMQWSSTLLIKISDNEFYMINIKKLKNLPDQYLPFYTSKLLLWNPVLLVFGLSFS